MISFSLKILREVDSLIYSIFRWDNRTSAVIPEEDIFYLVAFLSSAVPSSTGTDGLEYILSRNKRILDFCKTARLGVKQYLPHYTTQEEWRTHFGPRWEAFAQRKSAYDPLAILAPGHRIFRKATPFLWQGPWFKNKDGTLNVLGEMPRGKYCKLIAIKFSMSHIFSATVSVMGRWGGLLKFCWTNGLNILNKNYLIDLQKGQVNISPINDVYIKLMNKKQISFSHESKFQIHYCLQHQEVTHASEKYEVAFIKP